MKRLIVGLALAFFFSCAFSQERLPGFVSGNDLYQWFEGDPRAANAYVIGVWDGYVVLLDPKMRLACPSIEVTGRQVADVTKKYLTDHPEERHYTAASITIYALRLAFPCK